MIPTSYKKQLAIEREALLPGAAARGDPVQREVPRRALGARRRQPADHLCTNNEQEEAQEELEIDYKGDALDIGFNITYLLDVLNNLAGDADRVRVRRRQLSALITVPGRDDFKYVVMPMRI